MPGLDRRGPMGAGPMSGGRRGKCARPGVAPAYGGYGFGRGVGFRRGYNGRSGRGDYDYPPPAPAATPRHRNDELERLKVEQRAMRHSLDAIERRIAELGTSESSA